MLTALANGLSLGRIHHAYLFSGTRGVGKTSIARLLAKGLNCETGITATPCGVCDNCREIEQGRFVDLIEIDAASRTKVEDTRDLLDNVQYAPARGRFKVYLIDEVHMLSRHSFNALLKNARRAARARQIPAGDHRSAEAAGDHPVALSAIPS
ncbi:DNA polymerase III subunits gamma and tau [Citrobacter freundii]|uniref:DNA-directed DNA polymerase n=1 Tax=Citrobacter freundii TaxID=546 RepID=A0A7G2IMF0_CITFR|nr:DNA polymerase III subunits gamma and tau [Citrobacter freundii]